MREAALYRGCCCCFLGPVLLKVQLLRGLWGERGLQAREAAVGAASHGTSFRGRAHPGLSLVTVGLLCSQGQVSCH